MLGKLFSITAITLAAMLAMPAGMAAAQDGPTGRWTTIDDETGEPRSIVEIAEVNGELQGRIIRIFLRPDEKPDPVCEKCEGALKDQPVIGMTFLWGLKKDSDDWTGGAILDPKNGKTYNARLSLDDEGRKLRVRGYIGTPLLGRTQVWLRR